MQTTIAKQQMNDSAHDNEYIASSDDEIYAEDDHMTDNEEEITHDHVQCKSCGTRTHASVGKCSNKNCNTVFKFSAAGYLIEGEDDGFICDDEEEEFYDDEEEEDSDVEMEYFSSDESCSADDDDDDCEMGMVYDDEAEYVPKFQIDESHINAPRRITRSMKVHN